MPTISTINGSNNVRKRLAHLWVKKSLMFSVLSETAFTTRRMSTVAKTDWTNDHDICVVWSGSFANWDNFELSALLIECHRRLLRVEIEPHNFRSLKLSFWQRKSREGGISQRLPELSTIQDMIDEARILDGKFVLTADPNFEPTEQVTQASSNLAAILGVELNIIEIDPPSNDDWNWNDVLILINNPV